MFPAGNPDIEYNPLVSLPVPGLFLERKDVVVAVRVRRAVRLDRFTPLLSLIAHSRSGIPEKRHYARDIRRSSTCRGKEANTFC